MQRVEVKICGITEIDTIPILNEVKPNYVGFVFYPKSKRYVTPQQAKLLRHALHSAIKTVGVFVNENIEVVSYLYEQQIIEVIQLHGSESSEYVAALKRRLPKAVIWQAFIVGNEQDLEHATHSKADVVLLDSGAGSGKCFEWTLLKRMQRPYFLAGGLQLDNIEEALTRFQPLGVDISSGVETKGVKDPNKIEQVMRYIQSIRKNEGGHYETW